MRDRQSIGLFGFLLLLLFKSLGGTFMGFKELELTGKTLVSDQCFGQFVAIFVGRCLTI
jgi:hypothetical protein